jgi:hypothetical protein
VIEGGLVEAFVFVPSQCLPSDGMFRGGGGIRVWIRVWIWVWIRGMLLVSYLGSDRDSDLDKILVLDRDSDLVPASIGVPMMSEDEGKVDLVSSKLSSTMGSEVPQVSSLVSPVGVLASPLSFRWRLLTLRRLPRSIWVLSRRARILGLPERGLRQTSYAGKRRRLTLCVPTSGLALCLVLLDLSSATDQCRLGFLICLSPSLSLWSMV